MRDSPSRPPTGAWRCLWPAAGVLALYLAGPGIAHGDTGGPGAGDVAYSVTLTGDVPDGLRDRLIAVSDLVARADDGAPSLFALQRRMLRDLDSLRRVLSSQAYYDGQATGTLDSSGGRALVTLAITPGRQFQLGTLDSVFTDAPPRDWTPPLPPVGPATGAAIVAYERAVLASMAEAGHPDARVDERQAVLDRALTAVDVTWRFDAGPQTRIGEIIIDGLAEVGAPVVLRRSGLAAGQILTPSRLAQAEEALSAMNVFAEVAVAPAPEATGPVRDLRIAVRERKHRTVGGGAQWYSDEGFGVSAFWEHRNILGGAEQLRLDGVISEQDQSLIALFRDAAWRRADQSLVLSARVGREDTRAREELVAGLSASVEREIRPGLAASLGLTLDWRRDTRDAAGDSVLLGLPIALRLDASDDVLDPRSGYRLSARVTPTIGSGESPVGFTTLEAAGSAYLPLDEGGMVLAARGRIGMTVGPALGELPTGLRFYAGGGGSIRGYAFESVGPLDAAGDPAGGKSVIDLGLEMRFPVSETLGGVVFADAGNAFASALPDLGDPLRVGVGLGVRYYSEFGPIRIDVGVPLDKRREDDSFQVYVSIGQAF